MAGRNFDVMQTLERQIKDLYFTATFNGATFVIDNGYGFATLAKTDVGEYKLELSDKWVAIRSFDVIVIDSTVRNYTIQIKNYDVNPSSGKAYITFYTITNGAKADLPSAKIMGKVTLKNTTVF